MKIGIFGGGIVGNALKHGLQREHEVFVYDKFKPIIASGADGPSNMPKPICNRFI